MDTNRLQKLWDAYLITIFYNNPHYLIQKAALVFRTKHDIPEEEFFTLVRTPKVNEYYIKADAYQFVAQYLPELYKVIEPRSLEDLFDVLFWLRSKNIVTKFPINPDQEAHNVRVSGRRAQRQITLTKARNARLFGKGSKSNQAFFKASR